MTQKTKKEVRKTMEELDVDLQNYAITILRHLKATQDIVKKELNTSSKKSNLKKGR